MKARLTRILVAVVALSLLALGVRYTRRLSTTLRTGAAARAEKGMLVIRLVKNPRPVPAFSLPALDGKTISTAEWRGKATLINFWATWCPPCREEIPSLITLQAKYRDRFQVIGLSVDEGSPDEVRQFVKEKRINYPVGMASPELQVRFGGVMGLPTSFLVDPRGGVVQKHVGLIPPAVYEQEIRALLNLSTEARVETFEDTGQVSLANAARATELPGVDLSKLNQEQKRAALKRLNSEKCTCGCGLTLAQCRINDSACSVSLPLAQRIADMALRDASPEYKPAAP